MSPRKKMSPKKRSPKKASRHTSRRTSRRKNTSRSKSRRLHGGGLGLGLLPYKFVPDPEAAEKRAAAARKLATAAKYGAYGVAGAAALVPAAAAATVLGTGYIGYHGAKYLGKKAYQGAAALGSSYSDYNTRKGISNYQ